MHLIIIIIIIIINTNGSKETSLAADKSIPICHTPERYTHRQIKNNGKNTRCCSNHESKYVQKAYRESFS